MLQRHGGRAVREQALKEVCLQQGLEGSEMENVHRGGEQGQSPRGSHDLASAGARLGEEAGNKVQVGGWDQTKESPGQTGHAMAGHQSALNSGITTNAS